jgi:hypothetical protein
MQTCGWGRFGGDWRLPARRFRSAEFGLVDISDTQGRVPPSIVRYSHRRYKYVLFSRRFRAENLTRNTDRSTQHF